MKTLGIIAEYNPLHNGHLYHMQECKKKAEADCVIVVMSGDFTQRGEAAILDKWTRSRLAVENGADLVLELPFAYAVNSAEHFARGGVGILQRLGCVTHLGFGAEANSLETLQILADAVSAENPDIQRKMKELLDQGESYAKARQLALESQLGSEFAEAIRSPNNILAVEYLKQLKNNGNSIIHVMVNRKGAGYHAAKPEGGFASATAIRRHMDRKQQKDYVPGNVADALEKGLSHPEIFPLVQSRVLSASEEELSRIFSVGEGLENRMKDQIRRSCSLDDFVARVGSKRYPATRIRRILCQMLVGMTDFEDEYYARLLAAGPKGTALLKQIKKNSDIPVITNINKEETLPKLIKYDILAADLYNILAGNDLYKKSDYVVHPFIQKG